MNNEKEFYCWLPHQPKKKNLKYSVLYFITNLHPRRFPLSTKEVTLSLRVIIKRNGIGNPNFTKKLVLNCILNKLTIK